MSAQGDRLVAAANRRRIPASELREVVMAIGERKLTVRTLRHTNEDVTSTLFCVMAPHMFRGVSYVAVEERGYIPLDVHLFLPFAAGTLASLSAQRCGETFLGGDFAYDDMRTWLPEHGFAYDAPAEDGTDIVVSGRAVDPSLVWRHGSAPFRVALAAEDMFVKRLEYLREDASCARVLDVQATTMLGTTRIPSFMEMSDLSTGTTTSLRLVHAARDMPVDVSIFEPAERRRSVEYLASFT